MTLAAPGVGALLVAVATVAAVVAVQIAAIAWSKLYRERVDRIESAQREALLDDLIDVIERDDLFFEVHGTRITLGERSFEIPPPKGLRGRATRETLISLVATISGTGRERLIAMLEGAEYVDRVLRSLVSVNAAVRVRACMILGGMMSRRSIPWLSTRFIDDEHAAVRLAAAEALAQIGDPPSAAILLRAIHNRTRWQHLRIANVLSTMGVAAVPTLEHSLATGDDEVVALSLDILSDIGIVEHPERVEALANHANPEIRARAIELLGVVGDLEAIATVIDACKDEIGFVRVRAAKTLGVLGEPADPAQAARYRSVLQTLANDDLWWVRQHAANALAATDGVSA